MASNLAPLFESRETRNGRLPSNIRDQFTELESKSLDPEFGDRQFTALWMASKTGTNRKDVLANYDAIAKRMFGEGATPGQIYDKISETYAFESTPEPETQPEQEEAPYVPLTSTAKAPKNILKHPNFGYPNFGMSRGPGLGNMGGYGEVISKEMPRIPDFIKKIGSGSSETVYKTGAGLTAQAEGVTKLASGFPTRPVLAADPEFSALRDEARQILDYYADSPYDEPGSYQPVPTEAEEARLSAIRSKQRAISKKLDAQYRADMREWLKTPAAEGSKQMREITEQLLGMADEMDNLYEVDPEFAQSTAGQVAGYVGMLPTTVALAVVPVAGPVLIESLMFTDVEQDRKEAEGEDYDRDKAFIQNVTTASMQAVVEKAFGVEKLFGDVIKMVPKKHGKVIYRDYVTTFFREGIKNAVAEGATEPTQGFIQDFMASVTFDEGRELVTGEGAKRRTMEGLVGVAGGFLMGGGIATLAKVDEAAGVNAGADYLTTKENDFYSDVDFRILRRLKTDEEIMAAAPDPVTGKLMISAANGNKVSTDEYNQIVADKLFVEIDGVEMDGPDMGDFNGSSLGMINGSMVFKSPDGTYHVLDLQDPDQAAFVEQFKATVADQIRQQARNETAKVMQSRLEEGRKLLVEEETTKVVQDFVDEGKITAEQAVRAMEVARDVNNKDVGVDPAMAQVFGVNEAEYRNNLYTDVSRVFQGSTPLDVIEEVGEGYIKKRLKVKDLDESELKAWREKYAADTGVVNKGEDTLSDIEWFSKRVIDYAVGNRKVVSMPKSWGDFLRSLGEHLKSVLQLATKMKKLQRDGKLDTGFESALKGALGIIPVEQAQTEVADARAKRQAELDAAFGGQRKPDEATRESPEAANRLNYDLRRQQAEANAVQNISAQLSVQAQQMLEDEGYDTTFSIAPPVNSDAFKKWFGDSKVVDENGKPKVMYHGTDTSFSAFRRSFRGGIFLSPDPAFADQYAAQDEDTGTFDFGGQVIPAFVKSENPFDPSNPDHVAALAATTQFKNRYGSKEDEFGAPEYHKGVEAIEGGLWSDIEMFSPVIRSLGHDGMWVKEGRYDESDNFVTSRNIAVFEPTQVKSSIANRGTYDPTNPDITFSIAKIGGQFDSTGAQVTPPNAQQTSKGPTISDPSAQADATGADGSSRFRVDPVTRGRSFHEALERTRAEHPQGAAVAVYDLDTYLNPENLLFQSEDQLGGVMVTSYGDLQSVHKVPGSTAKMKAVLAEASEYASTLDAFDIGGFLPNLYGQFQFAQVARVKFSREYAPDGWNYETMGEPDVVFMVRDTDGVLAGIEVPTFEASEYEVAAELQAKAKAKVADSADPGPPITFSIAPPLESKAFKRWFGDSKIVNTDGTPMVVYHQTDLDFNAFDSNKSGLGTHFGNAKQARIRGDKRVAVGLTERNAPRRTIPVYLSIKNPITLSDQGAWDYGTLRDSYELRKHLTWKEVTEARDIKGIREALLSKGIDGIIYKNYGEVIKGEEVEDSYIAFEPTQIKSATGNRGTFDPTNPDITFSMDSISKVSNQYDGSRTGTASKGKVPGQRDLNVSAATTDPKRVAQQMEQMNYFTRPMKDKDGKITGKDIPFPKYLTNEKDPQKKLKKLMRFMTDNLVALYDAFPEEHRARATHWYDGARLIADHIAAKYGMTAEQAAGYMAAFSPMKDWFQNVQMALNFADVFANDLDTKITEKQFRVTMDEIIATAVPAAKKGRQEDMDAISGKTIRELWESGEEALAAWATRLVSTNKHGLGYDVLAPEGFRLERRKNKAQGDVAGENTVMVWQSTAFIKKALSMGFDGGHANISKQMGMKHKIRNFFNNIIAPNSPYGDVTSDTHNVNATLLFPMGGSAWHTAANFGTLKGFPGAGGNNTGSYWMHLEAVKAAAKKVSKRDGIEIQPRQMQSITWEAVRILFPDASKRQESFVDKIAAIWASSKNAKQAREQIFKDGIGDPEWANTGAGTGGDGRAEGVPEGPSEAGPELDPAERLRPRIRPGSPTGDDGSAVTFSLDEQRGAVYELSGQPITEAQKLKARYERITAKRLAASADLLNRQINKLPIPERVERAQKTGEATMAAQYLVPVSGRLQRISRELAQRLRRFEFDLGVAIKDDLEKVTPFMEGFKRMSKEDAQTLDLALKNGDVETRNTVLEAYNLREAFSDVIDVLEDARKRGEAAGYDIGQIEDYFPRRVIDYEGLRQFYAGDATVNGEIDRAIAEASAKARADGRDLTREERLEVVNRTLQRVNRSASKPGNFKGRVTDVVSVDASQFYADSATALIGYITSTNKAIEQRRFFGKYVVEQDGATPESSKMMALDASIGGLVDGLIADGLISASQQEQVISMLSARFNYAASSSKIQAFKSLGYMTTMGQVTSAITQFGDLMFSLYENGAFNTMVAASKAAVRKSDISREDLGIENVARELDTDLATAAKLLDATFTVTGLRYMDMIGKETIVNAKFRKIAKEAKTGKVSQKTMQIIQTSFGAERAADVLEDFAQGIKNADTMFAVYTVLADYQPISLSEYPQGYLENPNGRVFYMLKTFTLKQLESFRREGLDDIVNGNLQQKASGFRRLLHLAGVFYLGNIPVDWIKDWLMGRDPQLEDIMVDNLFKLMGISRWHVWNFRYRKNPIEFGLLLMAPPAPFMNYPAIDLYAAYEQLAKGEDIEPGKFESWRMLPLIGSPIYWHAGGGADKIEKRREEREGIGSRNR